MIGDKSGGCAFFYLGIDVIFCERLRESIQNRPRQCRCKEYHIDVHMVHLHLKAFDLVQLPGKIFGVGMIRS